MGNNIKADLALLIIDIERAFCDDQVNTSIIHLNYKTSQQEQEELRRKIIVVKEII